MPYFFIGNSQLITSVLAQYCPKADHEAVGKIWKANKEYFSGAFEANGTRHNFVAYNMGLHPPPQLVSGTKKEIQVPRTMVEISERVPNSTKAIVLMIYGNEFGIHSLVDRPPKWDFSLGKEKIDSGRQLVRLTDMKNYIENINKKVVAYCAYFKFCFPEIPCFYVLPPPPLQDENTLENPEIFGELFKKFGLRPFKLRKKIYSFMMSSLENSLSSYGVQSISCPEGSLTSEGALRADHGHGCIHGNACYGTEVMKAIEERANASV